MRVAGAVRRAAILVVAASLGLGLVPAGAQTRLPWADANPLEKRVGPSGEPRRPSRSAKPDAKAEATPPIGAVPVPSERPETETEAAEAMGPVPADPPAASSAPVPIGHSDAEAVAEPPAGIGLQRPAPSDPADAAERPVADIPVPDPRPSPAATDRPAAAGPSTPADRKPIDAPPTDSDELKARTHEISPSTAVIAAAAIKDAELCEADLKWRGVEFSVSDSISEGDCGVLRPVNVSRLSSGVAVSPDTQFLCRTALALDVWMSDAVVPAARREMASRRLTVFRHASTYVCRPRASESAISEHARGSAIDIAAFVFEGGDEIGVEAYPAGTPEATFQDAVRKAACGTFSTVLGPGTDADHASHFHLDIAARRNGSTYCR